MQSIENNLITLKDNKTDTIYQLPLDTFHQYGKPFAHVVSFPPYQYSLDELNHLWNIGLTELTEQQLIKKGIYGFILNGKVWDKTNEKFGEITELIPQNLQIQIRWDETRHINYTALELKALNIFPIHFIKLSRHVAYELSLDEESYLKAYISFKTKKLAQQWFPILNPLIGKLSALNKHENPVYQHLPPFIWEYEVEKFKHKILNNKLKILRKIASLDLQEPPP
ncbi:hypothetical protein PCC7424_5833 (plasmid) [Gloeothece citriformis PCC 7424]|uniref:Uncharacterized protein n=1 Tax=Gloeothece citriformis (strain PCC 7424) TaxID=65393 RepID=B7KM69_GLOC7|nr:hypothetical protein [Gloeothece citriformis]ACK73891.1 hypothetical protein PCC7424_5833 [Gloeothece citriformis PCC 7424]